jgi:hypothetical protein
MRTLALELPGEFGVLYVERSHNLRRIYQQISNHRLNIVCRFFASNLIGRFL